MMAQQVEKTANALAEERTDHAVERTLMAANRTLMAWIRTALSMIGFGFTIYKFLQAAVEKSKVTMLSVQGPRRLGLFLIALGTLSVILGSIEYLGTVKRLNRTSHRKQKLISLSLLMGLLIGLLGLLLFITILIHREVV